MVHRLLRPTGNYHQMIPTLAAASEKPGVAPPRRSPDVQDTAPVVDEPDLVFTNRPLDLIVDDHAGSATVIITDQYNAPTLSGFPNVYVIDSAEHKAALDIRAALTPSITAILGVGGCSALDVARYVAIGGRTLTVVPTILSTSCISVNRSIVYRDGMHQGVKTAAPRAVVVSFPTILGGDPGIVWKWSQSGFGDIFANISASIDALWRHGVGLDEERGSVPALADLARCALGALDWILSEIGRAHV